MAKRKATSKSKAVSHAKGLNKSADKPSSPHAKKTDGGHRPLRRVASPALAGTDTEVQREVGKGGSRLVDERIRSHGGWRAETLAEVRRIIHEAEPDIEEDCKWFKPTNPLGVVVWSHAGIICTGEAYKQVVKLTFARGASLKDPRKLFNSSLEGNARRAIDIREGEAINAQALVALIQSAVAENLRARDPKTKPVAKKPTSLRSRNKK